VPDRVTKLPLPDRAAEATVTRISQLAAIIRPELPDLAREIICEIRERIPEYARPMEGPYGQALRLGVQQALTSFLDSIADPSAPQPQRDHICRRLGQSEAAEGRSLDSLQAAYRVGAHVGWRRVMDVGLACGAPSAVMSQMAGAVLAYMDELATLSRQGYLEEMARSGQSQDEWRKRLLHLILERPQAPRRVIVELAELTGWAVPEEVTVVAMEPGPASLPPLADTGVLAEPGSPHPCLLLPGPVDARRREALGSALAGRLSAVGLTVLLPDAADSLRWARRALSLSRAGVISGGDQIYCEDHLLTLCLLSDEALVDQLARRRLGALAQLTPLQRQRLTETLSVWLETRGTAAEMAGRLDVHPQTVRYRMRKLERTLDGLLDEPDTRFALELVLRATRLRGRVTGEREAPRST
jgi:PucR-like helix-turn-helix protein